MGVAGGWLLGGEIISTKPPPTLYGICSHYVLEVAGGWLLGGEIISTKLPPTLYGICSRYILGVATPNTLWDMQPLYPGNIRCPELLPNRRLCSGALGASQVMSEATPKQKLFQGFHGTFSRSIFLGSGLGLVETLEDWCKSVS